MVRLRKEKRTSGSSSAIFGYSGRGPKRLAITHSWWGRPVRLLRVHLDSCITARSHYAMASPTAHQRPLDTTQL